MTGVGLVILLLERVLKLFDLVANPNKAFSYVGQMLVLLLPHFLSIALPAAFFFGVLLTFLRLKRDRELVALAGTGPEASGGCSRRSWAWRPLTMLLTLLIVGWLSPAGPLRVPRAQAAGGRGVADRGGAGRHLRSLPAT